MDLEREKQLRNEYADHRIVSNEQLERLKKTRVRYISKEKNIICEI